MEDLQTFINIYIFISLVWGVLCLILFFKIWGMTNDVRDIKEHLLYSKQVEAVDKLVANSVAPLSTEKKEKKEEEINGIRVGDTIIDKKTNKQYIVKAIYSNGQLGVDTGKRYLQDYSVEDVIKK